VPDRIGFNYPGFPALVAGLCGYICGVRPFCITRRPSAGTFQSSAVRLRPN